MLGLRPCGMSYLVGAIPVMIFPELSIKNVGLINLAKFFTQKVKFPKLSWISIKSAYLNSSMKRRRHLFFPAIAIAIACSQLQADIVTLKSGDRIEGKVLKEDDASITIEYKLTPKIKDTKIINKADIKELVRQSDALLEFEDRGLKKIMPTADLMSAAEYEAVIQDKLRTFAAKYPGTPETAEVEKIIATLGEEKSKVLDGQVKMMGQWMPATSVKRDTYNIEAYRCLLAMRTEAEKVKEDRYIKALREFDKIRVQFPASLHYLTAIPEANDLLNKYEKQLTAMTAEQPILAKQRADGLNLLAGPELQVTKSSIDAEVAAFKANIDAQNKLKLKWRDISKYDLKSLQDAMLTIAKERAELKLIDTTALLAENEILTGTLRYLADSNVAEATALMSKIPKGEQINKLAFAAIERQIKAMQDALKKQKSSSASSAATTAKPETTEEDPEKMASNPLAEALKKQQEEKDKKSGDATKAESGKPGDGTKAKAKSKPVATGDAGAKTAPAPVEEEGLLSQITGYLPIIGGLILAVLLGAIFLGKKKKAE
ncbi:hypothetical protein BH11VER1_BH11VER1_20940 [soil metagenome]